MRQDWARLVSGSPHTNTLRVRLKGAQRPPRTVDGALGLFLNGHCAQTGCDWPSHRLHHGAGRCPRYFVKLLGVYKCDLAALWKTERY